MEFVDLIKELMSVLALGGPVAIAGGLLMLLVRAMRLPFVQKLLPAKMTWAQWPGWLKILFPFTLTLGGSLLTALAAGTGVVAALPAALAAAVGAIVLHHGTKAAAMKMDSAALEKNPGYVPGTIRRGVGLVLPIDRKQFTRKLLNPVR
jgi:hypothetical protein